MPPVPFYRCGKCRKEFDSLENAQRCEDAHLTVVSASVKTYSIKAYPYALEVIFSNGETRIYIAEDMSM